MLDYFSVTLGTDFTNKPLFQSRAVKNFSALRFCGVMSPEGELRTDYEVRKLGDKLTYTVHSTKNPNEVAATIRITKNLDGVFIHELEHGDGIVDPQGAMINFAITLTTEIP